MNTIIARRLVNTYFQYLRNWDSASKKELILKLTESMDTKINDRSDFSSCFGAWVDDRSGEEIIKDLREDRINNHEIEDF